MVVFVRACSQSERLLLSSTLLRYIVDIFSSPISSVRHLKRPVHVASGLGWRKEMSWKRP